MSPPASLPDDIIFLIIQACIPIYEFIHIRKSFRSHKTIRRDSSVDPILPWQAFHANGMPNVLNLQLVNRSVYKMADIYLRNSFGGGLRLDRIEGDLERLILAHDTRLHWIIPRITHLSFPIHFQDLDKLNFMLSNGIRLPNLKTMHIEWQMRIVAWNFTNAEHADGGHLNQFVEQTVKAERQRKVSIGRYVDMLRDILGKQEGFKLTVDYIVELGQRTRHDIFYRFTVDVSTSESVVVAHKPLET